MKCVIILSLSLVVTLTSQAEVQQNETQIPDGEIDKNDHNKTGNLRMARPINELHRQKPAVSIQTPQLCQNIDILSKIWTLLSNYILKQDRSYVLVQEIDKIQSVLQLVRRYLEETPLDVRNLALIEKVNQLVAELEIQKTLKPITPYPNNGIWHNFFPTVPKRVPWTMNPSCKEALANLIKSAYTAYLEIIRNPLCSGDTLINPIENNYLPNQNIFENLDILLPGKGTAYPNGGLNYLLQYLLNKEENQYPNNIFPVNQGGIPTNPSVLPSVFPNINLDLITSLYSQRYPTTGHNINLNTIRPKQELLNPSSDQLILDYIIQQSKLQPIDKSRDVNQRDLLISQFEKLIQNNPGNVNPIPNIPGRNIGGKINNIYYKKYINGIPLNNNENGISPDISNGGIISGIVDGGNQDFVNGWNKIQYQGNVINPNLISISDNNLSPEPYKNLITHQLGNSQVVNPGLLDNGLNNMQYINKPKINPFTITGKGVYGSSRPDSQKEVLTSKIISPYNGQQVLLSTAAGDVDDKATNSLQENNAGDQQSEGVTDRIQWYSPDKSQVIELTYLLKQPKSIVYQPLSYVTYRMPYNKLVYKINDIIAEKPHLRSDPIKLYNAIINESNITEISSDLKIYDKSEITNLLLRNGTLIKARVVSNDKNLNAQDLQKLNSNPNDLNTSYLYSLIKSIDSANNGKDEKGYGDDDDSLSQNETLNFLKTNKPVEPLTDPYGDLLNSYKAASYQLNPMSIPRILPGALKRRLAYGTINASKLDTNEIIKPDNTDQDKTRQRNIQPANADEVARRLYNGFNRILPNYNRQVNFMGYNNLQPSIVPANGYGGSNQLSNQIIPAVLASQQSVNPLYPTGYPGSQQNFMGYNNLQPSIVPANGYGGSNQLSNQIIPAVLASQQSVNPLYPTGYPGSQQMNTGKR